MSGFLKNLVNTLVVNPTIRVTRATIDGAKSVGNAVLAGANAVAGNKTSASSYWSTATSQFKNSVVDSTQFEDIKAVKDDPVKGKIVGSALSVVGGVLTATGVAAPVGAALMTGGAYVLKASNTIEQVNKAEQSYKNGDLSGMVDAVGGAISVATDGTKYATLTDKYYRAKDIVIDTIGTLNSLSVDGGSRNNLSVDGGGVVVIGGNTLSPDFGLLDRILIFLFNLKNA